MKNAVYSHGELVQTFGYHIMAITNEKCMGIVMGSLNTGLDTLSLLSRERFKPRDFKWRLLLYMHCIMINEIIKSKL